MGSHPEVRKMVTSPHHGPDGHSVILNPGDTFGLDEELPDGALTKLTIVDVPDEPEGEGEVKAAPAAARGQARAAGRGGG